MNSQSNLERIKNYGDVNAHKDYYAFTLLMLEDGQIIRQTYSEWVGLADSESRIELRKASLIRADLTCKIYRETGLGCVVVNNNKDLMVFFFVGGLGLIEKQLVERAIPDFLATSPTVMSSQGGFEALTVTLEQATRRAPNPKLRNESS